MSYMKYILISLLLLASFTIPSPSAQAGLHSCLPFLEKDYCIYRVFPYNSKITFKEEEEDQRIDKAREQVRRNCDEWKAIIPSRFTVAEVYEVVYKIPYESILEAHKSKSYNSSNQLLKWLMSDQGRALLDYLLLAKKVEHVRSQMYSSWYYPTMKLEGGISLEQTLEEALSHQNPKLRPRYLLQAVRLLFTMQQYEECIELWEEECKNWSTGLLMREMIEPYIVGARYRLYANTMDVKYLADADDVPSLLFCAQMKGEKYRGLDKIKYVYKYIPHSQHFDRLFFEYRVLSQNDPCRYSFEAKEFLDFAYSCIQEGKLSNPALWYYTIAYLEEEYFDNSEKALQLLEVAEQSEGTPYIYDSIKLLRIYLELKLTEYGPQYEQMLFQHLRWLDDKITTDITDEMKAIAREEGYTTWGRLPFYYWDDMLRRIIFELVTPKLREHGQVIREIQLANMAENRHKKISGVYPVRTTETIQSQGRTETVRAFNFEYRNKYAFLLYETPVEQVIEYVDRIKHPKSKFDRFLNERGYTDPNYLNDIIGTKYLASGDYALANDYLAKVDSSFQGMLNSESYYIYDPFGWNKVPLNRSKESGYFKLDFVREMLLLEEMIEKTSNPNTRATLMITYATGMHNSYGRCWPLTSYDEMQRDDTDKFEKKYKRVIKEALEQMTNDELIARTHYMFNNYKFIAKNYPKTTIGRIVTGSCDKLIDYHSERRME